MHRVRSGPGTLFAVILTLQLGLIPAASLAGEPPVRHKSVRTVSICDVSAGDKLAGKGHGFRVYVQPSARLRVSGGSDGDPVTEELVGYDGLVITKLDWTADGKIERMLVFQGREDVLDSGEAWLSSTGAGKGLDLVFASDPNELDKVAMAQVVISMEGETGPIIKALRIENMDGAFDSIVEEPDSIEEETDSIECIEQELHSGDAAARMGVQLG